MRRQLVRKALWEEMKQEIEEELSKEEAPPVTTSHYKDIFVKEGFVALPIKTDPEVYI